MKWENEKDILAEIERIIKVSPGITVSELRQNINKGEKDEKKIVSQSLVSKLVNFLVNEGTVKTVFFRGQVFRSCYPADYQIVVSVEERPKKKKTKTFVITDSGEMYEED